MPRIEAFTRPVLTKFRSEFKESVKELEAKFGVKIDLGNISYDSTQFTSRITTTVVSEGVNPEIAKGIAMLKKYGSRYGLTESDFGRVINGQREEFTVFSLAPRSPKYPILAKSTKTGKIYKLSASTLKR